ncbi:MAG: hypothetical protein HWN81_17845 [Candidatus Lokiarchaeota archaeon]|nr:hypothetical protein [Candidatus Lokiarchaeota archaeon]
MIKKLFPPKKSVFTVDTDGDGRVDSLQIKFINLLVPFVIPEEIEIGDFNIKKLDPNSLDLSKYGKFYLDDIQLNFSKENVNLERVKSHILIYHKGESFNLNDIMEGKLSGRTINLNDTISILIKIDEDSLKIFTDGAHHFKIESDLVSNLLISFELDETNMNIRFDPDNI